MAILFLKTSPIGSFVRPSGYTFPTGLTSGNLGTPLSVDYIVVAGGAGGGAGRISPSSRTRSGGRLLWFGGTAPI